MGAWLDRWTCPASADSPSRDVTRCRWVQLNKSADASTRSAIGRYRIGWRTVLLGRLPFSSNRPCRRLQHRALYPANSVFRKTNLLPPGSGRSLRPEGRPQLQTWMWPGPRPAFTPPELNRSDASEGRSPGEASEAAPRMAARPLRRSSWQSNASQRGTQQKPRDRAGRDEGRRPVGEGRLPPNAPYRVRFGHSCPKRREKPGRFKPILDRSRKSQGADLQAIREKAAEGIRTLDLLHGKQTL